MALAWEDLSDVARKPDLIKQHASDRLWQLFGELVLCRSQDQPFVIAQLGQSLDGRIATPSGHSHYINGPDALDHLHRLRALVQGIVIGASTADLDDPSLTVRRVAGDHPSRVIIDPNRRVAMTSKCFADDGVPLVVVGPPRSGDPDHLKYVPANEDQLYPPAWIVQKLAALGLRRLLIEGGATTVSRFIEAQTVNRLHILTGPLIIGSGPVGLNFRDIDRLDDAIRPQTTVFPFDSGDILFDCTLSPRPHKT